MASFADRHGLPCGLVLLQTRLEDKVTPVVAKGLA